MLGTGNSSHDFTDGFGGSRSARRNSAFSGMNDYKKIRKQEEKEKSREDHYMKLVVRYDQDVDGGFLAPFGTYKSNLDFNVNVVRQLIIDRKLSPFYTPLQDYDASWTDEELLVLLSQLPLHSIEGAYEEEEEDDIDNHKIHKLTNYYKRQEQKEKIKMLHQKMEDSQQQEENRFMEDKLKLKLGVSIPNLPSKDLLLKLYRSATECPICFLYYPNNLNISRCCLQPICTECFVQIKRLDPHPPHEDESCPNNDELPDTLISEPSNCPYCAMTDFGVFYENNMKLGTGINGIKPAKYSTTKDEVPVTSSSSSSSSSSRPSSETNVKTHRARRSSIPADSPKVITIDQIRPDWEAKLASARNKLSRKSAAANAIHASNLIVNPNTDELEYDTRNRRRSSTGRSQFQSVEDRMIEEALRLSIIDEEDRKKKLKKEQKS